MLRKLFEFTMVRKLGIQVIFPGTMLMAGRGVWDLYGATIDFVHGMSIWQALPYITACALMAVAAGCGSDIAVKLRKRRGPF